MVWGRGGGGTRRQAAPHLNRADRYTHTEPGLKRTGGQDFLTLSFAFSVTFFCSLSVSYFILYIYLGTFRFFLFTNCPNIF